MALVIILMVIAAFYAYMVFETTWLKIERLDFSKKGTGLRIMHLTDLHVYMTRIPAERIRKAVMAEDPDVILITGDYINKPVHASEFLQYLHTFTKGHRTIICLGNHDYRAFGSNTEGLQNFIREIEALGVEVLINRTVIVEKDGKKYNIVGFDDLRRGNPDVAKAMEGCIPDAPKIAITHNPDLVLSIPGKIVDYMFAGHFHGGQIWMPFNLEFTILRDDQLCRMGIRRGLQRVNGIKVYLNRGLGNGVVPLRFLSRPEILICTIP
ncbi:MAG TPA: metallophosphoesterase [Clostridiales bacterium]|nr:metallophosphoesterase [Clostridiales bacterium]HPV01711.1 metallophosphoesterase [Clostridiales bacterium]